MGLKAESHAGDPPTPSQPKARFTVLHRGLAPVHDPDLVRALTREVARLRADRLALVDALRAVHLEAMDYPPARPISSDSYLPPELVQRIERALASVEV